MAEYAIGDVQGCYDSFRRLLDKIAFDPDQDTLWLTGDLVNRGPKSRRTLRFVKSLGKSAITVLGNHDLHLLALANDINVSDGRFESLWKILGQDDCDELIDWLRFRPLAHYSKGLNTLMIHAGLPPEWTVKKTLRRAKEVEVALRADNYAEFLQKMYGDQPDKWSGELSGNKRLRFIVNALTRIRMLTRDGRIDFSYAGPPEKASSKLTPWFDVENPKWRGTRIVVGHWSALGLVVSDDLIAVDTGCVWGNRLTAVRLDTKPSVTDVRCRD
ncbi:MAG: symmetrical bis(5'-nucleosyl)-tetraphosphatase [Proteobacteria bacterium]|nr:symmetrical bis(5'-nucleosyl)-tetraphosphatase [Pseudomonadota bacterium]